MMIIKQADPSNLDVISQIEAQNFLPEEAAPKEIIAERLSKIADTFLVAELEGKIAGYIEGPAVRGPYITDDLFHKVNPNPPQDGYLAVTSLSVSPDFKGQGIGSTLIAAFKDLAVAQKRRGITLTCHDYLISYYEMNGFSNHGLSESAHGGSIWYNMLWKNPVFDEES